jgi:hypothetical protein
MSKPKSKSPEVSGSTVVQFNLWGLVIFSISLVLASGIFAYALAKRPGAAGKSSPAGLALATGNSTNELPTADLPAWGDLIVRDIELERPEEYVAYEANSNQPPAWTFVGMNPDQTRQLLTTCGFNADQLQLAFKPGTVFATNANTMITPGDDLVLSLSPTVRAQLYHELGRFPENHYMQYPFCFPGQTFGAMAAESKLDETTLGTLRKLLYPRGEAQCFSDFEFVMRQLPSDNDRVHLVQALSRQKAVIVGLHVRPDSDIDKLVGYWGQVPNVRFKDIRPLLESLKRNPNGGSISLVYLLPEFARQHLYTFPLPSKPGDPKMDCHWSSLNFFNELPDNRFNDPQYTSQYISNNYYQVAKPTAYGDLVFLLDNHNTALHSAVYIADDLVFTKNGDNYMQPWMLMHLKDMLATYSSVPPPRMVVYRNKIN